MKKLLIITLTFFAIFAKAQDVKIVSKDSTTLYIGSHWLSIKYTSDYIILNTNADSIWSSLFAGITASTPTTYWTTGGTGITPTNSEYAVGIGMNPTYEKLDVSGNIHASNFTTTYGLNTVVGENAGNGSSLGAANTICGNYAGNLLTGGYNSFFGNQAGKNSVAADYNSCFGYYSGSNNTNGDYNSFFGARSGYSNSSGNYNTYMGYYTGNSNYGGSYNIFIGSNAGATSEVGSYDIFIGPNSGYNNDGNANVFIGYNSGYNETGSNKLYIENTNSSSPLIYGEFDNDILKVNGDFRVGGSNGVIAIDATGDTMATNEGTRAIVHDTAQALRTEIGAISSGSSGDIQLSNGSGGFTNDANLNWNGKNLILYYGTENTLIGKGIGTTTGTYNVVLGDSAGSLLGTSDYSTFVGYEAGYANTGDYNTFLGSKASFQNTTGQYNTILGYYTAARQGAGSNYNTIIGSMAGGANGAASACNNNSFFGYRSGYSLSSGDNNVCIGYQTGYSLSSGSGNIFIGYQAGYNETTGSNKLYIENTNSSNPLIYGEFNNNYLKFNADSILQIGWFKTDSIYTIKAGAWADYVFNPDYKSDIYGKEIFIKKYGHLPGLKSAEELDKIADKNNGYLTDQEYYRRLEGLVKEVEELTIELIKERKIDDQLRKENDQLKKQIYLIYNIWKDREYRGDF